ncbi:hypothetical protein LT493_02670 [Streptomyces tricolor]|nr:hypothetical protein [Streptomyces tricolor]
MHRTLAGDLPGSPNYCRPARDLAVRGGGGFGTAGRRARPGARAGPSPRRGAWAARRRPGPVRRKRWAPGFLRLRRPALLGLVTGGGRPRQVAEGRS